MKRLLSIVIASFALFSCQGLLDLQDTRPFRFSGPQGEELEVSEVSVKEDSEKKGGGSLLLWSKPGYALLLDFDIRNLRDGKDFPITGLSFGPVYSSDSRSYTGTFSGRIILKEHTKKQITLRMENVKFSIKEGECTMNGDIVCPFKTL